MKTCCLGELAASKQLRSATYISWSILFGNGYALPWTKSGLPITFPRLFIPMLDMLHDKHTIFVGSFSIHQFRLPQVLLHMTSLPLSLQGPLEN